MNWKIKCDISINEYKNWGDEMETSEKTWGETYRQKAKMIDIKDVSVSYVIFTLMC